MGLDLESLYQKAKNFKEMALPAKGKGDPQNKEGLKAASYKKYEGNKADSTSNVKEDSKDIEIRKKREERKRKEGQAKKKNETHRQ